MNRWFGNEGLLQTVFAKIWDLLVLNLCFLASCLPVVTVGAAQTALYAVNLKAVRKEEGNVASDFRRAFWENFRQATKLWLLILLLGGVFAVDFWALEQLRGTLVWILKALLGALFAVYLAAIPWIFAYQARFADTVGTVLKNALLLCGTNLPVTAAMLSLSFLVGFISLYSLATFLRAVFVWLVLGFAAVNYIQSYLMRRVFDKIAQA